jgi:hypothetical protein
MYLIIIFKTPNSIAIPQKYHEFSFEIILALNLPQLTKSFNVQLYDNIFKFFKMLNSQCNFWKLSYLHLEKFLKQHRV